MHSDHRLPRTLKGHIIILRPMRKQVMHWNISENVNAAIVFSSKIGVLFRCLL